MTVAMLRRTVAVVEENDENNDTDNDEQQQKPPNKRLRTAPSAPVCPARQLQPWFETPARRSQVKKDMADVQKVFIRIKMADP